MDSPLIVTITISSNVIDELAALLFRYFSVEWLLPSVIRRLVVIRHL